MGQKSINKNVKKKMGFCWPNMALTNPWIRPNIWSHFERENRREKEEEREEEEEEEKKKRRRREVQPRSKRYGTLEWCMNLWDFAWISMILGDLYGYMVVG